MYIHSNFVNKLHIFCKIYNYLYGENMAKKIAPTPVLKGEDAVKFLEDIRKPMSPEKKEFMNSIKKEFKSELF